MSASLTIKNMDYPERLQILDCTSAIYLWQNYAGQEMVRKKTDATFRPYFMES